MLDLLANAKSNMTGGLTGGQTGADVFRQVAGDRITPPRAVATVAFALAAEPGAHGARVTAAGYTVEILPPTERQSDLMNDDSREISGRARATCDRTGAQATVALTARWDAQRGFGVFVDGAEVAVRDLGRESRSRLLPVLLPRLLDEDAPLAAARVALDLGKDVVGTGDAPEDLAARRGYARLLGRVLAVEKTLPALTVEIALELFDAAGSAMASGSAERGIVEERVAELIETAPGRTELRRLAHRLGFADAGLTVSVEDSDEVVAQS